MNTPGGNTSSRSTVPFRVAVRRSFPPTDREDLRPGTALSGDTSTAGGAGIRSATLIGCGAIGSQLAEHLARMGSPLRHTASGTATPTGLRRILAIDQDHFEESNRTTQFLAAADVGQPKAEVVARRMRAVCPGLEVSAVHATVQSIPLATLRSDVLISPVDSRRARQWISQTAWRLGVPWIDCAVDGAAGLARMRVHQPGTNSACLECSWGQDDYAALEQQYACGATRVASTSAPTAVGGVAAALVADAVQQLVTGTPAAQLAGREVLVDLRGQQLLVTTYRRRDNCLFDHGTWQVDRLECDPQALSLADLLAHRQFENIAPVSIAVEGQPFVRELLCPGCGQLTEVPPVLRFRLPAQDLRCGACQREKVVSPRGVSDVLSLTDRDSDERRQPLADCGLLSGDIITVQPGRPDQPAVQMELVPPG